MKPVCLGITWGLFGYYLGLFGLLGIATPLPHPQLTTTTLDLFFFFFLLKRKGRGKEMRMFEQEVAIGILNFFEIMPKACELQ
jgi:hypothetical protein